MIRLRVHAMYSLNELLAWEHYIFCTHTSEYVIVDCICTLTPQWIDTPIKKKCTYLVRHMKSVHQYQYWTVVRVHMGQKDQNGYYAKCHIFFNFES